MTNANPKPFDIDRWLIYNAYKHVKSNQGSAGVDEIDIEQYELNVKNNLYKLWNKMSSGTYFPLPVKLVEIPKDNGGTRPLGIPTVNDRIAQVAVVKFIEPRLEKIFHPDSYGYRPNRSQHDALAQARKRCWEYSWVLDMDISKFFDTIDHELLMKAVRFHVTEKWVLLCIERWLKVPYQTKSGEQIERTKGVPQGSAIGPLLANLFLHYCFDERMRRNHPDIPFERFADDTICHCKTKQEAENLYAELQERFKECGLSLNADKTKIVYCQNSSKKGEHEHMSFDFLGYTFRPRKTYDYKTKKVSTGFLPAISNKSKKKLRDKMGSWELKRKVQYSIETVAILANPSLEGWYNYYGKFYESEFTKIFHDFNRLLLRWARAKYKIFRRNIRKALNWLRRIAQNSKMFYHWRKGVYPRR